MDKTTLSLSMRELMPFAENEIAAGREVLLPVKGNSMVPFLRDGRDSIYLSAPKQSFHVGDLVMFRREDGSYAMHRIYQVNQDGSYDIVGDNQIACDKAITNGMIKAFVPRAIRDGKEIDCTKGAWRFAMVVYMKLRLNHPKLTQRLMRPASGLFKKIHNREA
ncbi:MAG: S24/S26 family peptidase [Clostridia bacterium]|nr:S24/S26 family peptidase [Clostridia bacterium]